jgi:hypothetical protein
LGCESGGEGRDGPLGGALLARGHPPGDRPHRGSGPIERVRPPALGAPRHPHLRGPDARVQRASRDARRAFMRAASARPSTPASWRPASPTGSSSPDHPFRGAPVLAQSHRRRPDRPAAHARAVPLGQRPIEPIAPTGQRLALRGEQGVRRGSPCPSRRPRRRSSWRATRSGAAGSKGPGRAISSTSRAWRPTSSARSARASLAWAFGSRARPTRRASPSA